MPKGEKFWNPYRMIEPVQETVKVYPELGFKPGQTHEQNDDQECYTCEITALTDIYIGDQETFKKRRVIPGTSLKGMLRSVCELLTNSCACGKDGSSRGNASRVKQCSSTDSLCVSCRVFGSLNGSSVYQGRINISDANFVGDSQTRTVSRSWIVGSPKTTHESFYRGTSEKRRKLYFHQPVPKEKSTKQERNNRSFKEVQALPAGSKFEFTVRTKGLSEIEKALVTYLLVLERHNHAQYSIKASHNCDAVELSGPLRHKLGQGKAQGLGSIEIRIKGYQSTDTSRRLSLGSRWSKVSTGDLNKIIASRVKRFSRLNSEQMQKLRAMLIFDDKDSRDFRYPDYDWFNTSGNSTKPLKSL